MQFDTMHELRTDQAMVNHASVAGPPMWLMLGKDKEKQWFTTCPKHVPWREKFMRGMLKMMRQDRW